MPKLPLFVNEPLNTDAVSSIRHLLENPDEKGARELVEDLNQLSQNPTCTMPVNIAFAVCNDFGLIGQIHIQTLLLNCTSSSGVQRLKTGENAPKYHRILLEINDWVLRHAYAAGFLKPETK